jgi:hypothetical protein
MENSTLNIKGELPKFASEIDHPRKSDFGIGFREMDQPRDQFAQDHLPTLPLQIYRSTRWKSHGFRQELLSNLQIL